MSRDQQRQKVYNAEDVLRRAISRSGSTLPKDKQIPKGDIAAAQRYVDRAISLALKNPDVFAGVRERGLLDEPPEVFVHRSTRKASRYYQTNQIGLPDRAWAWRGLVLTHEVAHGLTVEQLPSHGPCFTHNFVELVRLTESRKLADELHARLTAAGIIIGQEAAIERALRYGRKVFAEAQGAYDREEYGANSPFAYVTAVTFAGKRTSGELVDVDVDGITVKTYGHGQKRIDSIDLAELNQSGRQYRP